MKAGVIRVGEMATERFAVLHQLKQDGSHLVADVAELCISEEQLTAPDANADIARFLATHQVVFVAVPGAYAFHLARAALRQGAHTFMGRAATPSIAECKALAALSEEAGAEVGMSRIMRFHPFWEKLPSTWRPVLLTVHHDAAKGESAAFVQMLEDAVDISIRMAGTGEVRRVEAQQTLRMHMPALLAGIRFQNGAYAQLQIRQHANTSKHAIYAQGGNTEIELDLAHDRFYLRNSNEAENASDYAAFEGASKSERDLIAVETIAYLEAIRDQKPVPVSIMEGLQTLQLVEEIRKCLR